MPRQPNPHARSSVMQSQRKYRGCRWSSPLVGRRLAGTLRMSKDQRSADEEECEHQQVDAAHPTGRQQDGSQSEKARKETAPNPSHVIPPPPNLKSCGLQLHTATARGGQPFDRYRDRALVLYRWNTPCPF